MADQQWPDDPVFRTFASKLADAAMIAIHDGKRIAHLYHGDDAPYGAMCPLGAALHVSGGGTPYPSCREMDYERHYRPELLGWLPSFNSLFAFIQGFDNVRPVSPRGNPDAPYYRLGQAYRERFSRCRMA